jgi:hypothetical protein
MAIRITFDPGLQALAQADQLAAEQGVTLETIAAEAFSASMAGVTEARRVDLDGGERG